MNTPLEKALLGFVVIDKLLTTQKLTLTLGEFAALARAREDMRLYLAGQPEAPKKDPPLNP